MSERLERVQDRDHEERTGEAGGGGGCLRQDAGVFQLCLLSACACVHEYFNSL